MVEALPHPKVTPQFRCFFRFDFMTTTRRPNIPPATGKPSAHRFTTTASTPPDARHVPIPRVSVIVVVVVAIGITMWSSGMMSNAGALLPAAWTSFFSHPWSSAFRRAPPVLLNATSVVGNVETTWTSLKALLATLPSPPESSTSSGGGNSATCLQQLRVADWMTANRRFYDTVADVSRFVEQDGLEGISEVQLKDLHSLLEEGVICMQMFAGDHHAASPQGSVKCPAVLSPECVHPAMDLSRALADLAFCIDAEFTHATLLSSVVNLLSRAANIPSPSPSVMASVFKYRAAFLEEMMVLKPDRSEIKLLYLVALVDMRRWDALRMQLSLWCQARERGAVGGADDDERESSIPWTEPERARRLLAQRCMPASNDAALYSVLGHWQPKEELDTIFAAVREAAVSAISPQRRAADPAADMWLSVSLHATTGEHFGPSLLFPRL